MADYLDRIGDVLGGYRLTRWLGGGGFGNVYLAEHVREGSVVAIKVLQIHLTQRNDLRTFINESRTIRLKHPHILPLLDFDLGHDDTPFLVMEYAPMGTVRQHYPKGVHVPLHRVVTYANQIASALQYAHMLHLVHRDIKPENMLLRSEETLQLSDFGLAVSVYGSAWRNSKSADPGIGGTVLYMAPEQWQGKPRQESDQYALAVVIYEWLAGRCPFVGGVAEIAVQHAMKQPPSLLEQAPGIPREVEEVLFKALSKNPKDRFASMYEFATAFYQASRLPEAFQPQFPGVAEPSRQASFTTQPAINAASLPQTSFTTVPHYEIAEPLLQASTEATPPAPSITQVDQRLSGGRHYGIRWYKALLLGLVLLLIGGKYAYPAIRNSILSAASTAISIQASATARVHRVATATAASISARAALAAYQARVTEDGIMFGFDAQHTHYNPYEQILNSANVSQLRQKWVTTMGAAIYSSPAVVNGVVYIGSRDDKLYAFNAATGQVKWVVSTNGMVFSSPAIAHDIVYIGSDDDRLYAFDAVTGQVKWIASTNGMIGADPSVVKGLVYIGSGDDKLYAFNALTGQLVWVATTGGPIQSSQAVAYGVVYIGSDDGKLYAFNAATGQPKWTAATGNQVQSSPAVAHGMVYVGSFDHKFYAFDAVTGQRKWVAATGGEVQSSPAVANGVVYVGSKDGNLYAFDAFTGQRKWVATTGSNIQGSPEVANNLVYVGSWDHRIYAFDAATGQVKWDALTGGGVFPCPAVVNGTVYVGSYDHNLYAFSLPGSA